MNFPIALGMGQYQTFSHKLNELLKNPNARLEEVIDEDCIINEFRDDKNTALKQ